MCETCIIGTTEVCWLHGNYGMIVLMSCQPIDICSYQQITTNYHCFVINYPAIYFVLKHREITIQMPLINIKMSLYGLHNYT